MGRSYQEIPIKKIIPPPAPIRLKAEETNINELATSIKTVGLINPITVRPKNGKYEVVAGHRRFLACQRAGVKTVPCVIADVDEKTLGDFMIAENLSRKDLSPVEEAAAFKDILDHTDHTPRSLGEVIGKNREYVIKRLRILDWPADVQKALHEGKISYGVAEQLAIVDDSETRARYLLSAIESQSSVKVVKSWVDMYLEARHYGMKLSEDEYGLVKPQKQDGVKVCCQICGRMYRPQWVTSVIVCRDCIRAINQALAALEAGDGRPNHNDSSGPGSGDVQNREKDRKD